MKYNYIYETNQIIGDMLNEGTWDLPITEKQARKLFTVMSKPMSAKDADKKLRGLVGDDELFDEIDRLISQKSGGTDVRHRVAVFLKRLNTAYVKDKTIFRDEFDKKAQQIWIKIIMKHG